MKKVKLPSGADLEITLAPFSEAKALYQAFLKELKTLKIDAETEMDYNFIKDIICSGLSSKEVDEALSVCMGRATYKKLKIDDDTFEDEIARGDYLVVCYEVARANLEPFTKGLFAKFSPALEKFKKGPELKLKKTT